MKLIKRILFVLIIAHFCFFLFFSRAEAAQLAKMIQIEAEIVEVNLTKCLELGIRWPEIMSGVELSPERGSYKKAEDDDKENVLMYSWHRWGKIRRADALRADLKILDDKGAARTLAQPKLITMSGSLATFLAGGQIPIPVQLEEAITIEWKDYGVKLAIKPTADAKNNIEAEIAAEVTDIDWANAVKSAQTETPAVLTRSVSARVNVKDGETVVIAGLKQTKKEKKFTGIPGLCRIPGLGALFGRQKWINNETTIFIFVTPSVVKKKAAAR